MRPQLFASKIALHGVAAWMRLLALALTLLAAQAQAQAHAGEMQLGSEERYTLFSEFEQLEDRERRFGIEDVLSGRAGAFAPVSRENFGVTDSALWLRITLRPQSGAPADWFLEFRRTLDHVDVFVADGATVRHARTGGLVRLAERDVPTLNNRVALRLEPGRPVTLYVRLQSVRALVLTASLTQRDALARSDISAFGQISLFLGLMIGLAIYNLFLFFALRDPAYLYYVCYVSTFALAQCVAAGLPFEYLWPDRPGWNSMALTGLLAISPAMLLLFVRRFLNTPQRQPRWDRVLRLIVGGWFLCFCLVPMGWYLPLLVLASVLLVGGIPVLLAVFITSAVRGYPGGRLLLLAWAILMIGALQFIGIALGILPPISDDPLLPVRIGTAVEMLVLSFALADRINTEKRLKEQAVRHAEEQTALARNLATATAQLEEVQARLVSEARQAGMAQIATNVLHNVGNVLTSVNVSAHVLRERVRNSRSTRVADVATLLQKNDADLSNFVAHDEKGRLLPEYVRELATNLQEERQALLDELGRLGDSVDHIKNVVAMQQSYAGKSGFLEPARLSDLADDALRMQETAIASHGVKVHRDYDDVPIGPVDKARVMQILVNLVENACHAMRGTAERRLVIEVRERLDGVRVEVTDSGCGIGAEHLARVFSHGFTTKEGGHGFGLHSSAIAAREMGGSLEVRSEGPNLGATFTLDLPRPA
ncbi:sensor histidine kinase [Ramlibacter sp.]|uniref:sensor histidine kinase n=1 Tax=Ramlibacter sp. TaxID=1917967 RepID=UPI003D112D35